MIAAERSARIAGAFAAASDYDRHARVQRQVANRLAARMAALDLPREPRLLEIGCGTGFLTQALADRGIGGEWLITDIAPDMVERCRARVGEAPGRRFAVLDGEHGARPGNAFDLICSSLAVQWFADAPAALARMAQWLAPGGRLIVTTLGPGSFPEWRAAHEVLGLEPGTPRFAEVPAFAALDDAEVEIEQVEERYADARAFVRALKAIGAGTAREGHRPLPAGVMRRVMGNFNRNGCKVSYQVVTCRIRRAR
jgi:Methylase involved in ubiquinone/menaquinone biosynthesis